MFHLPLREKIAVVVNGDFLAVERFSLPATSTLYQTNHTIKEERMPKQVGWGIYAGIQYLVVEKDGKLYISPDPEYMVQLMLAGATMQLLDDIGDQDPDDVMAAWLESIPSRPD